MYLKEPLELASFPSMLLVITVLRLALNIASSRLLLTQAYAGQVIQAFGVFVVGGNYIVGIIIFAIITIVNFVVITKGSERVAEVAARFTLDAMPGKQMSIDADLNAGLIDATEARARRRKIEQEATFFGSMDGANKFVRGDSIAQAYQFVATGNADLGLVALAQIVLSPQGSRWEVPQELYTPIRQDAVLLRNGTDRPAAIALMEYLGGREAQAIIERFGYGID